MSVNLVVVIVDLVSVFVFIVFGIFLWIDQ